tara:strand:+ start:499 stop:744 length:246 start_codon:yes stop_codon:yes gene_type:complete
MVVVEQIIVLRSETLVQHVQFFLAVVVVQDLLELKVQVVPVVVEQQILEQVLVEQQILVVEVVQQVDPEVRQVEQVVKELS